MIRIGLLFPVLLSCWINIAAQPAISPSNAAIENVIKEIRDFDKNKSRLDSIAGHPLGSNKEEDFLQRYNFYDTIEDKLNHIDRESLSFDDRINHELLHYIVEDEISSYKFKAYYNPILADEGFHTGLASMASDVLESKKDFDNYIKKLKDIPRYVKEHLALMRRGLNAGICQPKSILKGYENTYDQHIVNDPEKSIFWKPFLNKPFALTGDEWKAITDEGR
jgi:uncharacterized protein (DUF885 family)